MDARARGPRPFQEVAPLPVQTHAPKNKNHRFITFSP